MRYQTLAGTLCALLSTTPLVAQDMSALLVAGDAIDPDTVVTDVAGVAANNAGGFALLLNAETPAGTTALFYGTPDGLDPAELRRLTTIGNATQTAVDDAFGIADDGSLCYSATATIDASGGIDTIWRNDQLLIQTDQPIPGSPTEFTVFSSRPTSTADGMPFWVSGISASIGGFTSDRALMSGPTPFIQQRGGTPVTGVAELIDNSGVDLDFAVSANGTNVLNVVKVDASSSVDAVVLSNGEALSIGGQIVREGSPAANGRTNENWDDFNFFGVNEAGDFLFTGNSDTDEGFDESVNLNGAFVLREGDTIVADDVMHTMTGSIRDAALNEQGSWAVIWTATTPDDTEVDVLIVDGEIVLRTGDIVTFEIDSGLSRVTFERSSDLAIGPTVDGVPSVYVNADVIGRGGFMITAALRYGLTESPCPCEFGGDPDDVSIQDLLVFLDPWLETRIEADFNADGIVNIVDLLEFLDCWLDASQGIPCP